jgi:uncharacterized protein (TIGR00730 family)
MPDSRPPMPAPASVCVFCGSSPGIHESYTHAAHAMGTAIASRGLELVYGGGNVGLMGIVADAALAAGSQVTGVIPEALLAREIGHTGLTDLRVVGSMHERKAMMASLSDVFVALPGGFGTFEEFFEVVTWSQLGLHAKPAGLLNVEGFYDPLITFLDRATEAGFIKAPHRAMVLDDEDPERLLDRLLTTEPPTVIKWITPREA